MGAVCCRKCGEAKIQADFYFNRTHQSYDNTCKECRKSRVRENRREKLDYYQAYDRKRFRDLRETDPEAYQAKVSAGKGGPNVGRSKQAWNERNPEKRRAHVEVLKAKRSGRLVAPENCQACGCKHPRIEAHHEDYSKPLDVMWLCSKCHAQLHEKKRGLGTEAARA